MYAKKNGRTSFRSNRRFHIKRNKSSFSNNKHNSKGNISQLYEKYTKQAKVAFSSGDRIQAEYYNQFADHYSRLMTEYGIKSPDSIQTNEETNTEVSQENDGENEDYSNENSIIEKNESKNKIESNSKEKEKQISEESEDSIESVPFIAQPIKKNLRSKKNK